ncbi:PKD domain-containing protein [Candidatus Halobeggiatoa sp. HSG11]|nr:PKD domain-containing protein [Candidatus Halobeggiatoa sp. HSG11]
MFKLKKILVLGLITIFTYPAFANVSILITPSSTEVNVGDSINYDVAITNDGSEVETDVQITYGFSPNIEIGEITGGNCANGTCTLDELEVGNTSTINIPITITNTVHDVGSEEITLTVSHDGNPLTDDTVSILKPNLLTSITPSLNQVIVGQDFTYEIQINNDGTGNATGVTIVFNFPDVPNIVIGQVTGAGWNCDTTTCNLIGNLDAGITKTITIPVTTPDAVGKLKFITTANGDNASTGIPKIDENVEIFPAEADLAINQTASDQAIVADGSVRRNFVIGNAGPGIAQNTSAIIQLAGNSEFVDYIGDDWTCSYENQIVTCYLATNLNKDATSSLSIDVKGKSGLISNIATVTSNAFDPDETNNSADGEGVVVFTYEISPETGVAPDTILLRANSDVEGITFCWNGGEQFAVGEDTSIGLQSAGVSYLSLSVNNGEIGQNCDVGNSKEIKRIDNIMVSLEANVPPAAQLQINPQYLDQPGIVSLDASKSTDSEKGQGGRIVGYKFSLNGVMIPADGSWFETGTDDLNVENGFHTITAFVVDDKGDISTATSQVSIGDPNVPLANFSFTSDRMEAPVNITLQATENEAITKYEFSITDPNGLPVNFSQDLATPNVYVKFPITGNYRASLKVVNSNGQFSETTRDIYIGSTGKPVVNAGVSPLIGQQPHIVQLNPGFLDPDGFPYESCVWTIEDLNKTIEKKCDEIDSYTFSEVGNFRVELKAYDKENEYDVDHKVVEVYAPGTPVPTVDITPIMGFSPLTVIAVASAIDPNPQDTVSFLWDSPNGAILSPRGERTDITYIGDGEYDVQVTATDDSITTLSATSPVRTIKIIDVPQIISDVTVNCTSLTVNLGIDSENPYTDYFDYKWFSNDGQPNPAVGPNTIITFLKNTNPSVTLRVIDKTGTEKKITKTFSTMCDNVAPVANMAIVTQIPKGFAPFTVSVKDQGSYDPDSVEQLMYLWKAASSQSIDNLNAAETSIIFNTVGTHNIMLNVSDGIASTDSTAKTIEVIAPPTITVSTDKVCQSDSVTFSVPQEQGLSYSWSSSSLPDASSNTSSFAVAFEQVASPTINLQVTDNNGTVVNVNEMITVLPSSSSHCTGPAEEVQAKIIPVQSTVQVDNTLTFNGNISTGPIVSYDWLLNGEQKCKVVKCKISFDTVGNHSVTLVVRGEDGVPSSDSVEIEVVSEPVIIIPVEAKIIPIPSTIQVNQSLSVDGSISIGPIKSYSWSTSDGQTCSEKICSFKFTSSGTKNISLKVIGDNVNPSSATVSVEVVEPTPDISVDLKVVESAKVGYKVKFDGSGSTGPFNMSYDWFVDGTPIGCELSECFYTFSKVGSYEVTLKLSTQDDSDGKIASDTIIIEAAPLVDTPPVVPSIGIVDQNLNPSDGSTPTLTLDAGNNPEIIEYNWLLSDELGNVTTYYGSKPTFRFEDSGNFSIDLLVKDGKGKLSEPKRVKEPFEVKVPDVVGPTPPIVPVVGKDNVEFIRDDNDKVIKEVTLNAGDNPEIQEYKWTITDANGNIVGKKYGKKPTLSFDEQGEFTVSLTVKDKNGLSSNPKEVAKIKGPNVPTIPDVKVIENHPNDNGKREVILDVGEDNPYVKYNWTTSDGQEETGPTPKFTFDKDGEYFVDLTVKNKIDDVATVSKKIAKITIPQGTVTIQERSFNNDMYIDDDNNTIIIGDGTLDFEEPDDDINSGSGTLDFEEPDDDISSGSGTPDFEGSDDDKYNPNLDDKKPSADDKSSSSKNKILSFHFPNGDEYSSGSTIKVNLDIDFRADIPDCENADLWVAINLPEEFKNNLHITDESLYLVFIHKDEAGNTIYSYNSSVKPVPSKPQRYQVLSAPLSDSLTLLEYTIPDVGLPEGDYVFYSGLFKNGVSPLPDYQSAFCTNSDGYIFSEHIIKILK